MNFKLITSLLPIIAWGAMMPLFVAPSFKTRKARWAVWLAMGAFYLKFIGYEFIGGDAFNPELPRALILCWNFCYSASMILFGFCFLFAMVKLSFTIVGKESMLKGPLVPSVLTLGALGLTAYGMEEGVRVPRIKRVDLHFADLPKAFDGYRICQLSDLHISSAARGEHTLDVVNAANSLNADIVCITGDIVDGSVKNRYEDVEQLSLLKAMDGVIGCAGNHEFYSVYEDWRPVFTRLGIRMLDNESCEIRRGDDVIVFGGVLDEAGCGAIAWGRKRWPAPDVGKAFAGSAKDGFRILMQHRPLELSRNSRHGVRLQLSGHTHGGGIPFLDYVVKAANQGHLKGLYKEHGVQLYVSAGTGQWAGFPLRIACPSEITEIVLHR